MSAESHMIWMKSEDINKVNWSEGWIHYNGVRSNDEKNSIEIPQESEDDEPNFENIEGEIFSLGTAFGIRQLRSNQDDGDIVFEFTLSNIDEMIEGVKGLIREAIEIENDEEGEKSRTWKLLNYCEWIRWGNENVPEKLCWILRELRNTKKVLKEHPGYSLVMEIAY